MPKLAENRKALFDYEVMDKLEAGLLLRGFEVKAIKNGLMNLRGSYITIGSDGAFLINANISPYQAKNTPKDYDPQRPRKLLLRKKEINYLIGKTAEKGLTLVPISVYTKGRLIKLEFALVRSQKQFEKREKIKEREFKRQAQRILKY
ncbi:SsrA-binding protein SmpB [Candidatus Azambacteria bacterium]|nr:SsrA-binding protein SmpB [Candidatus Azambacteria bacterium]